MILEGNSETRTVTMNGRELNPKASQKLFNHSPDGFSWGYEGSGPAQLALAILLAEGLGDEWSRLLHQRLKRELIASLPFGIDFRIEFDLKAWTQKVIATLETGGLR